MEEREKTLNEEKKVEGEDTQRREKKNSLPESVGVRERGGPPPVLDGSSDDRSLLLRVAAAAAKAESVALIFFCERGKDRSRGQLIGPKASDRWRKKTPPPQRKTCKWRDAKARSSSFRCHNRAMRCASCFPNPRRKKRPQLVSRSPDTGNTNGAEARTFRHRRRRSWLRLLVLVQSFSSASLHARSTAAVALRRGDPQMT